MAFFLVKLNPRTAANLWARFQYFTQSQIAGHLSGKHPQILVAAQTLLNRLCAEFMAGSLYANGAGECVQVGVETPAEKVSPAMFQAHGNHFCFYLFNPLRRCLSPHRQSLSFSPFFLCAAVDFGQIEFIMLAQVTLYTPQTIRNPKCELLSCCITKNIHIQLCLK